MKTVVIPVVVTLARSAASAAAAQDAPAPELQIFRETDSAMTCVQISDEAAALSATMGGSQGGGVFGALGGVARSGAALLIPGAGLAIAGADVLTRPEREREEAREQAVQNRWYYLNGLYTGLRCGQAPEAPAPQASPGAPDATPGAVQPPS